MSSIVLEYRKDTKQSAGVMIFLRSIYESEPEMQRAVSKALRKLVECGYTAKIEEAK